MTDLTSIKQALAAATRGRWCQFHPGYCEEAVGTPIVDWDTSHDMSAVEDGKRTKRVATFKHAADAAYVDAVQPVIMRDLIASYEQREAENAALKAERDRLREALTPFARIADMEKNAGPDDSVMVNVARCRDARATLTDQQKG